MNKKRILLLFSLYLLTSQLVYSELSLSFDYSTPAINNKTECSHYYNNSLDEEFCPYQDYSIIHNINENKLTISAKYNSQPDCGTNCVIMGKKVIPLDEIFHPPNTDIEHPSKVALFSFEIDSNTIFNLNLEGNVDITVDDNEINILSSETPGQQLSHSLHPDTSSISFIFEISNAGLKINYMESHQGQNGIPSPTLIFHSERAKNLNPLPNLVIYNNMAYPLVMNQQLMVAMSDDHRSKRGTPGIMGCILSGPLALYNIVTHGRCNQVESAWASMKSFFGGEDKAKMQLVAGTATVLKPLPVTSEDPEKQPNTLILSYIDLPSLHQQSLTLPAVAKACEIPLENLVSSRFPRQLDGPACGSWLSRLLADFTLLFGSSLRDWSLEHLRQVLDSAIDTDSSGYAGNDIGTEERLVQWIRRGVRELGREEAIDLITRSFRYAERELANYYLQTNGADTTPSDVQNLPLGHYILSLDNYIPATEPVRIRRNGVWEISTSLAFQVEIISGENQAAERELRAASLAAINEWAEKYYSLTYGTMLTHDQKTHKETKTPVTAADKIIYSARIASDSLQAHLQDNTAKYLFVVVKLENNIVHMLEARKYTINNKTQEGHYYLANSLTTPKFIIDANSEGSVRGSGTAAVHGLADYLKNNGIKFIHSDVASPPSARVKNKLGFEHNEL